MSDQNSVTTPAMVARSVNYGDSDRILDLLTRDHGRVSVLARGARRSRKRFGGALALFVVGQATFKLIRGRDLLPLERFDAIDDLGAAMSSDVIRLAHGSYMLELTRELWTDQQAEPEGFALLRQALATLATAGPSPLLLRSFELQLLASVGLAPSLDRCVRCDTLDPRGSLSFDVTQGGVVCGRCAAGSVAIDRQSLTLMRRLSRPGSQRPAPDDVPGSVLRPVRELMMTLVRHHVGKELKTLSFIVSLGR